MNFSEKLAFTLAAGIPVAMILYILLDGRHDTMTVVFVGAIIVLALIAFVRIAKAKSAKQLGVFELARYGAEPRGIHFGGLNLDQGNVNQDE
jgi:hypothetical protein